MECEFCKKTFSSKSNLYTHQNSAKFCLELRGEEKGFECEFCKKKYAQKKGLISHIDLCEEKIELNKKKQQDYVKNLELENGRLLQVENILKEKLKIQDEYIAKLEGRVSSLQKTISDIASQPTYTYENTPTIPIPLHEQMESIFNDDIKNDDNDIVCSEITINDIVIISRPIDHYIDATQLCKAGGKKFEDWLSLDSTKEFIREIESIKGISSSLLVETNKGDTSRFRRGSWIHFDLSIQLAHWLSPTIAIQVTSWLRTLFKETLDIDIHLLREKERDLRLKDKRIKQLENVCLSKQRRVDYQEHNVIYLLTTDDHLSRRTYIIGKAKNLKTRLSTYNKTCDHTVVYYRECKNEDDMSTVETMVLSKLHAFREQANRDRFILPEDRDVSFFTQTIDECIRFLL
jgi:hypothetical protein